MSAISGTGTGELMEQLMASLAPPKSSESVAAPDAPLAVAIIGRPNVGKSSLLNSLVRYSTCPFLEHAHILLLRWRGG